MTSSHEPRRRKSPSIALAFALPALFFLLVVVIALLLPHAQAAENGPPVVASSTRVVAMTMMMMPRADSLPHRAVIDGAQDLNCKRCQAAP